MAASAARCVLSQPLEPRPLARARHERLNPSLLRSRPLSAGEDLLTSLSSLAAENRFDHVIVESSGISEPLPVAETFTFRDKATNISLNDVARLHNLVTVVDAASALEQLSSMDTLVDRGWHEVETEKRTVSHLLCDQVPRLRANARPHCRVVC